MHNKVARKAHFENGCAKRLFTVYAVGVPCPFKKVLIVIPPALYHCSWHFKLKKLHICSSAFFIPSKIQKYPKVVIFVFVFVLVLMSMLVPWAVRQSLAESLFFVRAASAFALDNRQCNKPTTKSPLLLQNTRLCCSFFYPDKNNAMLKSGGTSTELACFKLQNMSWCDQL